MPIEGRLGLNSDRSVFNSPSMDLESRLWVIVCANGLAFGVFVWDKGMSKWKKRRVPESTLLILTLLGGGVGAICGMLIARHKTRKRSFQWKFWPSFLVGIVLSALFITM